MTTSAEEGGGRWAVRRWLWLLAVCWMGVQAGAGAMRLTLVGTGGPELVRAAAGRRMDVLVANVAAGAEGVEGRERWRPVFAKLMTPEGAARLFGETRPRLAVYSHVVKKGLPGAAGDGVIVRRTRAAGYRGPLVMGRDGMRIVVGRTVRVLPVRVGGMADLDGMGGRF